MSNTLRCNINKLARSLKVNEIYYNETGDFLEASSFYPGNNMADMKFIIKINSQKKFYQGTKLKLRLVGYKDNEYVYHQVEPIDVYVVVNSITNNVEFEYVNKNLPMPLGISYISPNETQDELQDGICKATLYTGNALEYYFVLFIKCKNQSHESHVIPINVRYVSFDAKVDVKCERVIQTDSIENTISVSVNNQLYYFIKPHCVTHGQVTRPVLLNYSLQ